MKNFTNFLNVKLKNLSIFQSLILYLVFIVLVLVPAIFYVNWYIEISPDLINSENKLILKNLKFDYGSLLHNLYYNAEYSQQLKNFDLIFHLARMPFYPMVLLSLSKISLNFYFIFFCKNLIIFTILFVVIFYFLREINTSILNLLIFLGLFIYNPYNLHILLCIDFVDTFISIFFPLILILALSREPKLNYVIPVFIFILYLSKSSMWIFCLFFSITIFMINYFKKNFEFQFIFITPIISVFFAILIWGFFGLNKSNYFPIGASLSSTNTYYMNSIMNKKFNETYPQLSVDTLIDRKYDYKKFNSEQEFYKYFKNKNFEFIKNNQFYYVKGVFKKLEFILFGIEKDANKKKDAIQIRYSNLPNKIIMNFALVFAIVKLIINLKQKKNLENEILFLSMFILYLMPYLIAWATSKHLVPLFLLSKVYLMLKILKI